MPDVAPLYLAVREGLFQRAGMTVQLLESEQPDGTPDLYFGSWAGHFLNIAHGSDFVLIGEACQAAERYTGLVVAQDSNYQTMTDKPRPRVGITELNGIGKLLTSTTLGLADAQADFVQTPSKDMASALLGRRVDAVWAIEPEITTLQVTNGAHLLADTASGPTQGFPLSGYGCERTFAKQNPNTIKVFQNVLAEAQEMAADASRVRSAYIENIKIDPTVAQLMARPQYPVSLNATRLQRVADHMLSLGQLPQRIDVRKLVQVS